MKNFKIPIIAFISLALLSGCGDRGSADLEGGWEVGLKRSAARALDLDYDFRTGEIIDPPSSLGPKLALSSADNSKSQSFKELLDETITDKEAEKCESFVSAVNDESTVLVRNQVDDLLFDTWLNVESPTVSEEFVAARDEINTQTDKQTDKQVAEQGPNLGRFEDGSSAHARAIQEIETLRDKLREEMWQDLGATDPQLLSERNVFSTESKEIRDEIYSSTSVKDAQILIIRNCKIEVSPDFEYLTPQELEIEVWD